MKSSKNDMAEPSWGSFSPDIQFWTAYRPVGGVDHHIDLLIHQHHFVPQEHIQNLHEPTIATLLTYTAQVPCLLVSRGSSWWPCMDEKLVTVMSACNVVTPTNLTIRRWFNITNMESQWWSVSHSSSNSSYVAQVPGHSRVFLSLNQSMRFPVLIMSRNSS